MSDMIDHIESMADLYNVFAKQREEEWKEGIHVDQNDNEYLISEMTTSHLENTIRYFKKEELDVSPLEEELKKRK